MDKLTEVWLSMAPEKNNMEPHQPNQAMMEHQMKVQNPLIPTVATMWQFLGPLLQEQGLGQQGAPEPEPGPEKQLKCISVSDAGSMNLYAAMNGYDLQISNPYDKNGDPAIKNRIFLHDCYDTNEVNGYNVFRDAAFYNFISDVRLTMQCDADMSLKTYSTEKEYNKARSNVNEVSKHSSSGLGKLIVQNLVFSTVLDT